MQRALAVRAWPVAAFGRALGSEFGAAVSLQVRKPRRPRDPRTHIGFL